MTDNLTDPNQNPPVKKRIKGSYLLAVLLALATVVWIASGVIVEKPPVPQKTVAERNVQDTSVIQVRVMELSAVDHPRLLMIAGRTDVVNDAEVKAETSGKVIASPVSKGSMVEKGAVLLELAMDDRQARLNDAEAKSGVAKITYEASKNLQRKQFESQIKLAQSNADLAKADAELAAVKLDIARTKIRAPIAGYVETLVPGPGDYVKTGDVVSLIVDLDPMRVIANVTERDLAFLHLDDLATIKLPGGREVGGTIRYLSKVASDVTRTFRIDIWIDNPDASISSGLTADVQLNASTRKAHQLPTSALTLNDQGMLGVRTVDDADVVHFMPVSLLDDTTQGAWVSGLPNKVRIITVGQEFVVDGQKVVPVDAAAEAPPAGGVTK